MEMKKVKRSVPEAYINDERFKSWIRKVSSDDSLFHCTVCNNNFSYFSISNIIRHAESAHHKKNIGENTSFDKDNVVPNNNKVLRKKRFKPQWLEIEQYKPWLQEVQNDVNSFTCTFCKKTIVGGLSQIYRHANSKKHIKNCPVNISESNDENVDKTFLSFDDQKRTMEIQYAALIAERNLSFETAQVILNFFQKFENLNLLRSITMGRTKCVNIVSNVLCPIETNQVVEHLQNTKFSVFVDETSDISNEKWMTFHVRYVHPETLNVQSQLVKLINLDATNCSADKLFNSFKNVMYKLQIPFSNIIALSCDNASVMTGKHVSFKKKLEEMCKGLITLPCPCHSAALVAHAACAQIPHICEEFIKNIGNYINSSPKRAAIFREFTDCFQEKSYKILKLCDTRWLSRHACIERILESWDTIKLFLNETIVNDKAKSAENLLCIMQNVDTKAYLLFLKYILHFFNIYNAYFQAAETRVHMLQPKSKELFDKICTNFLKNNILNNLLILNFDEIENHKSLNDINLGIKCEEYLCQMMKDGHLNAVATVRQNCLQFYITAAKEIRKRLPVNDIFLSQFVVLLPHIALDYPDREKSFYNISYIAKTIGGFDSDGLKKEWFAIYSDLTVIEKENLKKLNFDNMWIKILQEQYLNKTKYPNLKSLLNCIRSLPNSNADPERIFSLLSSIKTKQRNKLSSNAVNSICIIKSALKARKETALNMKIDEKHLSLMSSDKLYANSSKRPKSNLALCAAQADDIVDL